LTTWIKPCRSGLGSGSSSQPPQGGTKRNKRGRNPKLGEGALSNTTKSALYLDFDNVFLSVQRENPAVAFAEHPGTCRAGSSEVGTGFRPPSQGIASRRFLVRRCYLSPERLFKYRRNLVRAGFSVVDFPAPTMKSKNSAGIYMVMDIADALAAVATLPGPAIARLPKRSSSVTLWASPHHRLPPSRRDLKSQVIIPAQF
jgi:hypothetical protein